MPPAALYPLNGQLLPEAAHAVCRAKGRGALGFGTPAASKFHELLTLAAAACPDPQMQRSGDDQGSTEARAQ